MDVERGYIKFVPNSMLDFINESKQKSLDNIVDKEKDEFLSFIEENEFGIIVPTEIRGNFTSMSTSYECSSNIDNAIIDYDFLKIFFNINDVINQLSNLGCRSVELRLFNTKSNKDVKNVVSFFEKTRVEEISICINWFDGFSEEEFFLYSLTAPRFRHLIVFGASENKVIVDDIDFLKIEYTVNSFNPNLHCGHISQSTFTLSRDFYLLAKNYNTCLYKKVGVSVKGDIKNCTSSKKVFGNVNKDPISRIVSSKAFTDIWFLDKSMIEICSVCEFRYLCSDCRIYTDGDTLNSKPKKCSYDPYSMSWH